MELVAIGHDVVDVAVFARQLAEPGSRMRELFSARELRQCAIRAQTKHDGEAAHLAVRWAGKESVLKAWCEALGEVSNPYTLDDFPWTGIEILNDSRSRPHIVLRADVEAMLCRSLGSDALWHISLSHDGPIASAVVALGLATTRISLPNDGIHV
ncbi:MAG: holo-ACP synthase [Bifidobacterium sp.]|jgi:holo-[acyl-carrier protein] synthase|nr:holo-ACP synthase [Bifidobacterium sp.]